MSITGLVAQARARHEALMTQTCTITRVTNGSFNTTTGSYATTTATIYSGKCRLRSASAAAVSVRETDTGDAEQSSYRYALIVPYSNADSVLIGDVAAIGSRSFTVVGRIKGATTTAGSLLVEEVEQ